jgi:prepilin-type N-terminal cleavage/methylation domain-containing protein
VRLITRKLITTTHDRGRGFTLLELLIVLALMAGIMALAWPNLRKPLGQTPLKQSAAAIRELIDECRYQATLRGELTLLRLERNSPQLQLGSWETLLEERLSESGTSINESSLNREATTSISTESSSINRTAANPSLKRQWLLPEPIVIEQLLWTCVDPSANQGSEFSPSDRNPISLADPLNDTSSITPSGNDDRTESWYVPFLPSGQSRDLSIILLDSQTQKRIMVRHRQGNGLIDIIQLPDANASRMDSLGSSSSFNTPPAYDQSSESP